MKIETSGHTSTQFIESVEYLSVVAKFLLKYIHPFLFCLSQKKNSAMQITVFRLFKPINVVHAGNGMAYHIFPSYLARAKKQTSMQLNKSDYNLKMSLRTF